MNLRGIDLNLLVILDALLDEAHVSRAAVRLGLSQPATSAALDRCRALFQDPLLERSAGGMRLTPRANDLRAPLREALDGVAGLVGRADAELGAIRQTVRLSMADVLGALIVPPLHRLVHRSAPGIHLVFAPWSGGAAGLEELERGGVDLVVSVVPPEADASRFHVEELIEERYRVAMRDEHPAAAAFDLDQWLSYPHVVVSAVAGTRSPLDDALAERGLARQVGVVLPSFLLVPDVLRHSDMIGMVPSLCLGGEACRGLVDFDPPFEVPGFTLRLALHRRHVRDPAVRFVADKVRRVLRDLAEARSHPSGE